MDNSTPTEETPVIETPQVQSLDHEQVEILKAELKSQENLPLGLLGGVVAAIVGGILWAVVTVITSYQIGYMAIGVGYLVGFAILKLGKGTTKIYGIVGAILALVGCLLGNLLTTCGFIAQNESLPLLDVIIALFGQPRVLVEILADTFSPIDLLFYVIAIHGGYKTAIRTLTDIEIREMVN